MMTTPTSLVVSQKSKAPKAPIRNNDRIILHFDYDCFYASVFENENPALKSLPLGIKQKSILATCNYVARARGIRKLMLVSEAQKLCPNLVLMNGEDLTRFRDASKRLWTFLRSHSWNNRVERLGLDEVFMDVSDIIEYNLQMLNPHALATSFFQLSPQDPEKGFPFDANSVFGSTHPKVHSSDLAKLENPLYVRLLVASHLAGYLRHKLEEYFGHTSTCGVSTNKVLAKLAGSRHKPKDQTTFLGLQDNHVQDFMDSHKIRQIPGVGFKISHLIDNHVLSSSAEAIPHDEEHSAKVTTSEVLAHLDMSSELLERILGGPGAERGIGDRVWNLLHGVDNTEVKEANIVPTQISIEDTYVSKTLSIPAELVRELQTLSTSLVRRMRVDLLDDDAHAEEAGAKKWVAYPKTLRLSTRVKSRPGADGQTRESFNRSSRSQPLPNFVFNLNDGVEQVAERLANEAVLPLFRRLHPERQGWNLALINICVTNMVLSGNEEGTGAGRDISLMFRTQDAKLKEWRVHDSPPLAGTSPNATALENEKHENFRDSVDVDQAFSQEESEVDDAMAWEAEGGARSCPVCGHVIPEFAMPAHERFHVLGD